jgi:hypothetical protein
MKYVPELNNSHELALTFDLIIRLCMAMMIKIGCFKQKAGLLIHRETWRSMLSMVQINIRKVMPTAFLLMEDSYW